MIMFFLSPDGLSQSVSCILFAFLALLVAILFFCLMWMYRFIYWHSNRHGQTTMSRAIFFKLICPIFIIFAFLLRTMLTVFFILIGVHCFIYWKIKNYNRATAFSAMLFATSCSVMCVISICTTIKKFLLIFQLKPLDVWTSVAMLISNVLMLIFSAIVGIASYKNYKNLNQGRGNEFKN